MRPAFCWGSLRERDNLEELGIDKRIISKLIFKTYIAQCTSQTEQFYYVKC